MERALLIVDMQNDFMPWGALGVPGADEIAPLINALMPHFRVVIATLDDHPPHHVSFASSHPGCSVGQALEVAGIQQILWPDHCVQGRIGSALYAGLDESYITHWVFKGQDPYIDSYSAFFDNARQKSTGLEKYLACLGVTELVIVGLTTEYCVLYSALDAQELGFKVMVLLDACRSMQDTSRALQRMRVKGIQFGSTAEFLEKS